MRLLKLGVYYPVYLEQFYARRPGLAAEPYAAQHAALIDDCFGSSDFWTCALSRMGYETCDLVINAEPLQRAWAAERGLEFDEADWLFKITEAQVKDFSPDALIVADYSTVTAAFLRRLREACPSLRLVLGWCGAPYGDGSVFARVGRGALVRARVGLSLPRVGPRSRHVNHAFEPRVLDKLGAETRAARGLRLRSARSSSRNVFTSVANRLLARLVEETGLQIWSEVGPPPPPPPSRLRSCARALRGVPRLAAESPLTHVSRGAHARRSSASTCSGSSARAASR